MEDDAYSVFLAQASRAARLEADPAAEEYVDPIQSVATFTGARRGEGGSRAPRRRIARPR